MDATLPEMLTPGDVASWLHTTSNFVLRLVKRGEIPHLILPNGDVLFYRAELAEWVKLFRAGKVQHHQNAAEKNPDGT